MTHPTISSSPSFFAFAMGDEKKPTFDVSHAGLIIHQLTALTGLDAHTRDQKKITAPCTAGPQTKLHCASYEIRWVRGNAVASQGRQGRAQGDVPTPSTLHSVRSTSASGTVTNGGGPVGGRSETYMIRL